LQRQRFVPHPKNNASSVGINDARILFCRILHW
jgi:hypothetical protein